ncbi:M48 family metalloprotease [Undibacterium sp. LX40W]|uniref:M48 family metalloprotease n=1 Tax=Undibacterium nitidum TaxID=2762298 RepID=A0A923HTL0_9BURK|nr:MULTISPECIES: M48 family metalloprotease [Undibacterium]MBC3883115.1 M48 family metalloprotease [Undibacterium nitidum]MBC3893397.1 M48 family metalloprotease [Undibacterium sp. LX40W]
MKPFIRSALALSFSFSVSIAAAAPSPQFKLDFTKAIKTASDAVKVTKEFSEADEIALGQEVASNLLSLGPVLENQEVQNYVNKVGRWVSSHSERPDLPWTFVVLDSLNTNAFAAPGGYIVITRGLLQSLNSEAELAGLLGHEISHVIRKHHLSAIKKADATSFTKGLGSQLLENSGKANNTTRFAVELISGVVALYGKGLEKDDEFEADRMGVVLATRAGYDPFGLPAALQTIQSTSMNSNYLQLFLETHPKPVDRLNQLDRVMGSKFDRYDGLPSLEDRFLKIKESLISRKK